MEEPIWTRPRCTVASAAMLLSLLGLLPVALGSTCAQPRGLPEDLALPSASEGSFSATQNEALRHVIERRCVVCHACYDAPCQLILSSREGLWRGGNKATVYRSSRLRPAQPTRLGIDAQTVEGWRALGFHSVTEGSADQAASLILGMLALGAAHDFAPDAPLPDDFPLALDRQLSCPTASEFGRYAHEHPAGGMPYGMASLSADEYALIGSWAASEAPTPPPPPLPADLAAEVAEWERLLNQPDLKVRVIARYVFEHWVFADLWFSNHPDGPFFEIVRSATPPGEPIDVISTRFPFEEPGVEAFWYRLRRASPIVAYKNHITYELGAARRARFKELFLGEEWQPTRYPSWKLEDAANPFVSFAEIPARARYQFLLDDAEYFVRTFIRGPVCNGQAATDVIQDRFFVTFLDPDHDISIVDPDFLRQASPYIKLPAEAGPDMPLLKSWSLYDRSQKRYRDLRAEAYRRWLDGRGVDLDFVWQGDGDNQNAFLTVFRNYDNAMVMRGFVGAVPKTAWVMDYPVFERIYYDLVAGFDVFGNVGHQLAVRFYMDNLRFESEDLFLALMPEALRESLRASWYEGATREIDYAVVNKLRSQGIPSEIQYESDDPKAEIFQRLLARNPRVSGPRDWINRCNASPCDRPDATALERRAERAFQRLSAAVGSFARDLPELFYVRVAEDGSAPAVYTLLHDTAHTNVAAIFREEARLKPSEDRVTIVRGIVGSYPNFVFDVPGAEIDAFVDAVLAMTKQHDLTALVERWGVRRSSPRFWSLIDWLHEELVQQGRREAGILDLNRYQNL